MASKTSNDDKIAAIEKEIYDMRAIVNSMPVKRTFQILQNIQKLKNDLKSITNQEK